jgi:SAM-dependent methyltransferase
LGTAKALAERGLLCYQPFSFDDSFEVGVGWEFTKGEFAGLIHWPDVPEHLLHSPEFRRLLSDPAEINQFRASNLALSRTYDDFADAIVERFGGDVSGLSFMDVGCNSGYMPAAFALRGAGETIGIDREDYSETIGLLNDVLGTGIRFEQRAFDPRTRRIEGLPEADVVTSMLLMCHLPDPMGFLAEVGRSARKALFIWNGVVQDARLRIQYGEADKYYADASFPHGFDYDTRLSTGLMLASLRMMGFTEIHQLDVAPGGLEGGHYFDKRPILAIRSDATPARPSSRRFADPALAFDDSLDFDTPVPTTLGQFRSHNLVAFRGSYYGAPFGVPVDWDAPDLTSRTDIFRSDELSALCHLILWASPETACHLHKTDTAEQ